MRLARVVHCAAFALVSLVAAASPASAQFRGQVYVSGLTHPLAFVQDPSTPSIQYVVEQEGLIRIVNNGVLVAAPFLDLRGAVATGGEKGLIGLVFPSNYATSGRFFVSLVNLDNHLVIARFTRSADPLVADPASRVDLRWSDGNRFITHPAQVHYGGSLVFGSDGYLYIGTGDGGESNDPNHNAQNTSLLLGKMLRIDVNVDATDAEGFDIPAGNPFASGGGAPEIWSIGFRNPWRFSLDDPARGGTGALVIADVGESRYEEVNYEPAGRARRNYGWRNREGAHDFQTALPPAFEPLTDPIHEYDHAVGRSITGGFVYRGNAIPSMRGRYVFGDFANGRIASVALTIDSTTGEATASDVREHTAEIRAGATTRFISSFGIDADGEIYAVNWLDGTVVALRAAPAPAPFLHIDTPVNGSTVRQPFMIGGWALDASAALDPGISDIQLWAFSSTGTPYFVGVADRGGHRPDVGAFFGPQFDNSGYGIMVRGLPPGNYLIGVYGFVTATQTWAAINVVAVTVEAAGILTVDTPADASTVDLPFLIGGWALDPAAPSGTGIATIHAWAFRADGGATVNLGAASFGARPDVAAIFGPQFSNAGYGLIVDQLTPGTWHIGVYGLSTVSGLFDTLAAFMITVR
jgi:glucose/arabinose dehydrogenase